MADDNKDDQRKNFPNGFFWFLIAAFLIMLMLQNFVYTKFAKVSFSYQIEHLVNLQLIQPENSHKTALNDNLVTFSGKFRERKTDESINRFKYLDLLDENHRLTADKERLEKDLSDLKVKILESTEWFLQLTGTPIPEKGYVVVDDKFYRPDANFSVVVTSVKDKNITNLKGVEKEFAKLKTKSTAEEVALFGTSFEDLLSGFTSPILGIGSEQMKHQLRMVSREIRGINTTDVSPETKLVIYQNSLTTLKDIVNELNTVEDHYRLSALRSVRNYRTTVEEYNQLITKLEDNVAKLNKARHAVQHVIWYFNNKEISTAALEKQDPEQFNHWFLNARKEWKDFDENKGSIFRAPDQPLNTALEKTFKSEEPTPNYISYLFTMLPVLLVVLVLYFLFSRQMKGVGNSAMNFGKSPAKLLTKDKNKVTFKDVAGIDEALEELEEIVEFLKNPTKFTALGGRIPKGVLCIGPPGTGKTLMAKAVAGEADRPFFSISGSDFVEMFVGVGASRIRDMFDQAKKNAPCIIFIDEIDAVGRHRGAGIGGGHDEREQTLNQLLVEMDGFDTNEGVILMAATNRPDVLDKALLRPGRFDRRVVISLPDVKGRFDILKVHARKIKLDPAVDLMAIARATPGCSGADLMNILNEAALLAARNGRLAVTNQETVEARDKVLYGKERRSLEIDKNEKLTTAYHESGHAIVSLLVDHADPIDKVTIIPRGMSLGATHFLPKKNRTSYWRKELVDQLAVLMGGRCAEQIFIGDISSGARQDIDQATNIARSMVCEWGMSEQLGPVSYKKSDGSSYMGMMSQQDKEYSEVTAQLIDGEVKKILQDANERAMSILEEHRQQVELMTQKLIEYETLDIIDVQKIIKLDWDPKEKEARVKLQEELHKKKPETNTDLPSGGPDKQSSMKPGLSPS